MATIRWWRCGPPRPPSDCSHQSGLLSLLCYSMSAASRVSSGAQYEPELPRRPYPQTSLLVSSLSFPNSYKPATYCQPPPPSRQAKSQSALSTLNRRSDESAPRWIAPQTPLSLYSLYGNSARDKGRRLLLYLSISLALSPAAAALVSTREEEAGRASQHYGIAVVTVVVGIVREAGAESRHREGAALGASAR